MKYNLPGYDAWKTNYGEDPEDDSEYETDNDKIEIDEEYEQCLNER